MPLLVLPTKTDGSIGREKSDGPDPIDNLDVQVPAAEYERVKTALIDVSDEVGPHQGAAGDLNTRATALEAATATLVQDNLGAVGVPTATDDANAGYARGSMWVGTNFAYILVDPSPGFADWIRIRRLSSSDPEPVGDVASVGGSADASPSNHVHAHGSQTNPTHHALATTSDAGFMSAADKVKTNQAILADGSVAMAAPFAMGGEDITNIGTIDANSGNEVTLATGGTGRARVVDNGLAAQENATNVPNYAGLTNRTTGLSIAGSLINFVIGGIREALVSSGAFQPAGDGGLSLGAASAGWDRMYLRNFNYTNASPAIARVGDSNTGVIFPADGEVGLAANGLGFVVGALGIVPESDDVLDLGYVDNAHTGAIKRLRTIAARTLKLAGGFSSGNPFDDAGCYVARGTTTEIGTGTTTLDTFPLALGEHAWITVRAAGYHSATEDGFMFAKMVRAKRDSGGTVTLGTTIDLGSDNTELPLTDLAFDVSGTAVRVRLTDSGGTIEGMCTYLVEKLSVASF